MIVVAGLELCGRYSDISHGGRRCGNIALVDNVGGETVIIERAGGGGVEVAGVRIGVRQGGRDFFRVGGRDVLS